MSGEDRPGKYWFRAMRNGWGWGAPGTWQGWVFLLAWMAATVLLVCWIGHRNLPLGFAVLHLMVVGLLMVVITKGEPPRWRKGR